MPGIVGFTSHASLLGRSENTLRDMQLMLTHKDFYVKDDLYCDFNICATRTHTGVVQIAPQPYCYESKIYVWIEGELYDQENLINVGSEDQTYISDPWLLAYLYKKNNNFSFLKQVNGVYSAVIYDIEQSKIFLITDRYGLQPLYMCIYEDSMAWSSEVKAMLALPSYEPRINMNAVKDFFQVGYLLGNKSWLEDIELVGCGTIVEWDIKTRKYESSKYWDWNEIQPRIDHLNENDIISELEFHFKNSIARRTRYTSQNVGLTLSGGLDSRAILAALEINNYRCHALTLGQQGCEDIRIAALVAAKKGVEHHIFHLTSENWFKNRVEGVWWTDGQLNLMHMHVLLILESIRDYFTINLDGYLGDAILGGYYFEVKHHQSINDAIDNRGRRLINEGGRLVNVFVHNSKPFLDNDLVEFMTSLPKFYRKKSYIYNKMLLNSYPDFFETIPWQKTGFPIGLNENLVNIFKLYRKIQAKSKKITNNNSGNYIYHYTNYPKWITQEPAKSFFENLLNNKDAHYHQYLPSTNFKYLWETHLDGKRNYCNEICQLSTFEIWLQQVFNSKYRPSKC